MWHFHFSKGTWKKTKVLVFFLHIAIKDPSAVFPGLPACITNQKHLPKSMGMYSLQNTNTEKAA